MANRERHGRMGYRLEYCDGWDNMPYGAVWIHAPQDSFFCQYDRSPDSSYLVAWTSINSGGKIIIAYQERVVYLGNFKRPQEAAISNNGVCIFDDASVVYVMNFCGNVLFTGEPGTSTVGISPDGHYAAYMVNSDILCFVDVYQGQIAWRYRLPDIWPQFIVFDDDSKIITLKFEGNKSLVPRRGGPVSDYKITYPGEALTPDAKNRATLLTQEQYDAELKQNTAGHSPDQQQIVEYKPILYQLVKDNPGILQSDLKKRFPPDLENVIGYANWSNCQEGKIRREKKGRSFQLWIVEGI